MVVVMNKRIKKKRADYYSKRLDEKVINMRIDLMFNEITSLKQQLTQTDILVGKLIKRIEKLENKDEPILCKFCGDTGRGIATLSDPDGIENGCKHCR